MEMLRSSCFEKNIVAQRVFQLTFCNFLHIYEAKNPTQLEALTKKRVLCHFKGLTAKRQNIKHVIVLK